jgi:hypothetical protein
VELVWSDVAQQPWHATEQAIAVAAGGVTVTVANRGQLSARNVEVSVRISPTGSPPQWTPLTKSQPQDVPSGGTVAFDFNPTAALPQAPYLIWASATCPADRW